MSDLVLSSSSVAIWLECHLAWWFRYVLQSDGDPGEQLEVGIAVHEHAESELKDDREMVLSSDPAVLDLVDVWREHIRPELGVPRLVEAGYRLNVNGIPYQSILDVVDEGSIVRDLKTTAKRPPAGRYRISLIGHALGFRALTGEKEKGRALDYVVRAKTPYYWPETFEGPATMDEVAEFGATIENVAAGIDRGEFAATGLDSPWACATCPYRAECGPRIRYEEGRA